MDMLRVVNTHENNFAADQLEESELIVQAGEGDEGAFGELYARYLPDVKRSVRSNVGNIEDAEDIAQEALMRVYSRISEFEDQGKGIGPYVGRIAQNLCVDRVRRIQNRPKEVYGEHGEWALDVSPSPDDTEQQALDVLEPLSPKVQMALDELQRYNPDFYQAVIAICVQGKRYQEYAEEAELPLNTVRTRIHRAKDKLQGYIKA